MPAQARNEANIRADFKTNVFDDDRGDALWVTCGELDRVDATKRITEENDRTAGAEFAKESFEITEIVFARVADRVAGVAMTSLIKSDNAPAWSQVRGQLSEREGFHPVSVEGNHQAAIAI